MAIIKNYLLSKYITQKDKHKKFTSQISYFQSTQSDYDLFQIHFLFLS